MTMTQDKQKKNNVTKQNAILIGLTCLMLGFSIGVFYTSYKLKPSGTKPEGSSHSSDFSEKETALKNVLSQNPEDVSAWSQLGHLYFDTKQYTNAIDAYQKALAIEPGNADVLTDLGIMYRKSNQPLESIKSFDKAIAADPKHEQARFNKGIVLINDLDDQESALAVWEELLSINPIFMSSRDQSLDQLIQHYREH